MEISLLANYALFNVVDNVVYMGAVNISSKIWMC